MSFKTYIFPLDLMPNSSDYSKCIMFMPMKSIKSELNKNNGLLDRTDTDGEAEGLLILPTPTNLSDSQTHSWSQETTIDAFEKLSSGLSDSAQGISAGAISLTGKIPVFSALLGMASGAVKTAGSIGTKLGQSSIMGFMSMMSGQRKALVNPQYFQNYTSSTPRAFEFNYTFQPRSQEEALSALNIIRAFKQFSSPTTDTSDSAKELDVNQFNSSSLFSSQQTSSDQESLGIFGSAVKTLAKTANETAGFLAGVFGYIGQPDYWKITFGNSYLNKLIKLDRVVCTGVNVTYGDGSKLETFKDGIPKIISLSISFAEVKMCTSEDYSSEFTASTKSIQQQAFTSNDINRTNINKGLTDASKMARFLSQG